MTHIEQETPEDDKRPGSEVSLAVFWMQAHCLLHFSELAELTDCLALLSDADLYISRIFNTQFVSELLSWPNVAHVKAAFHIGQRLADLTTAGRLVRVCSAHGRRLAVTVCAAGAIRVTAP